MPVYKHCLQSPGIWLYELVWSVFSGVPQEKGSQAAPGNTFPIFGGDKRGRSATQHAMPQTARTAAVARRSVARTEPA